ncbi:MAG: hypothetical protein SVV03_05560, partial [Candidatus Nanohaloarchaea archaeon]|nr:hypothetical protein [Candidatus Nanohaloarchaea archaeon]
DGEIKIEGLAELPSFLYDPLQKTWIDADNQTVNVNYIFQERKTPSYVESNCTAAHAPIDHRIKGLKPDGKWRVDIEVYVDRRKTFSTVRNVTLGEGGEDEDKEGG